MSFFIVFIFCLITSIYFCCFGVISNKLIYKIKKIDSVFEYCILGLISLSFFGLFSNFFTSLNLYFNSILLISSIIYFFFLEKKTKIQIFNFSFIISLVSLITIVLDYTNRPDAGLYHLPFTSLINDQKIIIGSANLNERFGIISIIQYLSAINYNLLFLENGILIPLVLIYSSILVYFLFIFFDKNKKDVIKILSFLFFIFILINLNRYSGFGNDAPAHLFYFILTYYYLEYYKINPDKGFKFLILISVYIFLIKPFFIILFTLPIIFFLNNKNVKIFSFSNFFCGLIISIWFIKNVLVTGCILYPIDLTCIPSLDWTLNPSLISLEAEAWTKGWPDRNIETLNYKEYLKNFYWINTWINNHFKLILIKLSPFLLILFVLSLIIIIKNNRNYLDKDKTYYQLILLNFIFLLIWFFSFPNYRFGLGIIGTFISLLFIFVFFDRINLKNNFFNKSLILLIFLTGSLITFKNIHRIYSNYASDYVDYPWPRKNSHYSTNEKLINKSVKYKGEIIYYIPPSGELCFYSQSPCTHITNLKIKKTNFLKFYKQYSIDK